MNIIQNENIKSITGKDILKILMNNKKILSEFTNLKSNEKYYLSKVLNIKSRMSWPSLTIIDNKNKTKILRGKQARTHIEKRLSDIYLSFNNKLQLHIAFKIIYL